jgi:hypothetical protein
MMPAPIFKRALIEFWPQLIAAIGWAAYQAYYSPDKPISVFISQFFMAFSSSAFLLASSFTSSISKIY